MAESFPPHSRVQFPRGTTALNNGYIGKPGEFTIDMNRKEVRLHDGIKPGGHRICSLTELQSIFLTLESEAANLNFPNGSVGFLARVSDQAYAVRKFIFADGLTIQNPNGVDDPNDNITGDPIFGLPARLKETQVAIVNANLHAIQTGFYATAADTLNVPEDVYGKTPGYIMTVRETDQNSTQVFLTKENTPRVYIRSQVSGSWQPWTNVTPITGDIETLMRGTDKVPRVWSAHDMDEWIRSIMGDMSSGDDGTNSPTLYNSKKMFSQTEKYDMSGSTPAFTKTIDQFKIGDRFIVKMGASAPITSPNQRTGCDIVVNLKLGTKMVEVLNADAPARAGGPESGNPQNTSFNSYRLENNVNLRFAVVDGGSAAKKIKICDQDWVIIKDLTSEDVWDGTIQFDVTNGTRQIDVSCYRIRPAA